MYLVPWTLNWDIIRYTRKIRMLCWWKLMYFWFWHRLCTGTWNVSRLMFIFNSESFAVGGLCVKCLVCQTGFTVVLHCLQDYVLYLCAIKKERCGRKNVLLWKKNLLLHLQFCDQVINLEIRGNTCIALFISTGGLLFNLYICMHTNMYMYVKLVIMRYRVCSCIGSFSLLQ